MHLLITTLITLWLWEFVRTYIPRAPDWVIHIIAVPSLACAAWFVPAPVGVILAAVGGVMLLQMMFSKPLPQLPAKRRRSNIPPPP